MSEGGIGEALDQAEELPVSLKLTDTNRLSVIVAVVWHGPSIPGDLKNPLENASKTHWSIGLSLRRYSSRNSGGSFEIWKT